MNYRRVREQNNRQSTVSGIALAVGVHVALVLVLWLNGLTYLDPPPPEQSILIEFTPAEEELLQDRLTSIKPQVEHPDPDKPMEMVQRSEAQHIGQKPNKAPESTVGDKGDVEVNEPPREKPIDNTMLFHAANNKADKDTLAPQTASAISDNLKAGHPEGNTKYGKVDGEVNGLRGRSLANGFLPEPEYPGQESGIVVVSIKVNQYGKVTEAKAGAPGTTLSGTKYWNAARNAAMKTVFNQAADAPVMQEGTIKYSFKITK